MIKNDCIHFRGDKPCAFNLFCDQCSHFKPYPAKILVIKCRAMGDVLRTTALLPGLKRKYPQSFISWLVDEESVELLFHNPHIDKIILFRLEAVLPFLVEKFDILISLDKESGQTALATKIQSRQKFGFGLNEYGNLMVFNPAAEYAFALGIDNELKYRRNTKTYQEIIYDIAEIDYQNEPYVFELKEESREKARHFLTRHRVDRKRLAVSLNTGAGTKFITKQWPVQHLTKLIRLLTSKLKANVFLLGGTREREMNRKLARQFPHGVYNTGSENSLLEFAGFISFMDILVSSDSLGMHLGIALGKKVIALFGPTCPQEISLYGRGMKLFAGVSCAPCYFATCPDGKCMSEITPEQVFEEIIKIV
ncbi:MAG: glycosyltransferase family 9 protein [Candidatus Aminicenantales bacterium]